MNTQKLTRISLLTALAILIPMVMPVKIIIGPASYTLASHVPLMLAILIQPQAAVFVALGSTLGFFMAGFPPVIVARALSHLVFAYCASTYLKNNAYPSGKVKNLTFNLSINAIHALMEVIVVTLLTSPQFDQAYFSTVLGLVGLGTLIHGAIDWLIAEFIAAKLNQFNHQFFPLYLKPARKSF